MEKVLGQLVGSGVLIYLNEVLLYANDPKELIELLREVLKRLIDSGQVVPRIRRGNTLSGTRGSAQWFAPGIG